MHGGAASTADEGVTRVRRRVLDVPGTLNLRDLGGYLTVDGSQTAWDRVFRSETLGELGVQGWNHLRGLDIRHVVDLRLEVERVRRPYELPDERVAVTSVPIGGDAARVTDHVELLRSSGEVKFWAAYIENMYRGLVCEHGSGFAHALEVLAGGPFPALFHCTAGKDRTGMLAALLLLLLGVERETVLTDYELTTMCSARHVVAHFRSEWEAAGVNVDAAMPFLTAPRAALEAALDEIEQRHGGAEDFLRAHGMSADAARRLRTALLEER